MYYVEVLNNISLIGRAVSTIEPRFTIRVLRTLNSTRKKLDKESLKAILDQAYPKGCTSTLPPHSCSLEDRILISYSQDRSTIDRQPYFRYPTFQTQTKIHTRRRGYASRPIASCCTSRERRVGRQGWQIQWNCREKVHSARGCSDWGFDSGGYGVLEAVDCAPQPRRWQQRSGELSAGLPSGYDISDD